MHNKKSTKGIYYFLSLFFILISALSFEYNASATEYNSTNFKVFDPIISGAGISGSSVNFGLGQSAGQIAPGKATSTNFQLWSGYQYYFLAQANTLTATTGSSQVSLSWTVPATYLGAVVGDYELGTGTVSGSYVFQDVGNVTNFTKTGLTNGTPYYFKIKAKTAAGTFLIFSNEATATPVAAGGGGGGGGGGGAPPAPPQSGTAGVTLKGLAYPSSTVVILKDGVVVANTTADPAAAFNVTISNLAAANYNFSVYTLDKNNNQSTAKTFPILLTSGVNVTVDNIFLAPSINIDHEQIAKGDTLSIFGYATPKADVNVFVNSNQQFIEKVQAEDSGAWFKAFNTALLEYGDHSTKSQAAKNNKLSDYSATLAFKVADETLDKKQQNCTAQDINCDSKINLIDLSIMLYYWNKPMPAGAKSDLNSDGMVDLVDLSILLYHWTG